MPRRRFPFLNNPKGALAMTGRVVLRGKSIPIRVRRSPRARRVTLRMAPHVDAIELVLPRRASYREGMDFLRDKADWVVERHAELPARIAFEDGAKVPLKGAEHRVRHRPNARGGVWLEAADINVSGEAEHLPRRVLDYLKRQAQRELARIANDYAERIGRKLVRVSVRDMRSRWGSCSDSGRLTLSWRLILAPERIARYVVAHEVAHLLHMNHGRHFWAAVERLMPDYAAARAWLRDNAGLLHRYG